ncbi:uncharacterized protein M6G45_015539 [Spheniscus humboldti]
MAKQLLYRTLELFTGISVAYDPEPPRKLTSAKPPCPPGTAQTLPSPRPTAGLSVLPAAQPPSPAAATDWSRLPALSSPCYGHRGLLGCEKRPQPAWRSPGRPTGSQGAAQPLLGLAPGTPGIPALHRPTSCPCTTPSLGGMEGSLGAAQSCAELLPGVPSFSEMC